MKLIQFLFINICATVLCHSQTVNPITDQATDQDSLLIELYTSLPTTNCSNLLLIHDSINGTIVQLDARYDISPFTTHGNCNRLDTFYLSPLPAGNYQLIVYNSIFDTLASTPFIANRWSFYTDSFTISTISSLKEEQSSKLELSPNPVQHQFQIKNSKVSDFKIIQFWNLQGQLVKETPYNSTTINISDLSSGVYIARLIGEERMEQIKIVKE